MAGPSNPKEQSMNPRRIYPNGILPDWVNPLYGRSWEPKGSLFPGPSDNRETFVQPRWGYDHERARMRNGFAEDITGNPYTSTEPEWSQAGTDFTTFQQRYKGYKLEHDPSPDSTADPKSHSGKRAANQHPGLAGQMAMRNPEAERIKKFLGTPVVKIGAGLAGAYFGYKALKRRS